MGKVKEYIYMLGKKYKEKFVVLRAWIYRNTCIIHHIHKLSYLKQWNTTPIRIVRASHEYPYRIHIRYRYGCLCLYEVSLVQHGQWPSFSSIYFTTTIGCCYLITLYTLLIITLRRRQLSNNMGSVIKHGLGPYWA